MEVGAVRRRKSLLESVMKMTKASLLLIVGLLAGCGTTNTVTVGADTLESRLKAIIIPEVGITGATAFDLLEFIGGMGRSHPETRSSSLGIVSTNRVPAHPSPVLLPADDPELKALPSVITLSMHNVSLFDALTRMAQELGVTLTVGTTNLLVQTKTGRTIMNIAPRLGDDGGGQ